MIYKLKISSQNQVTLPIEFIKSLNLKPGSYLFISKVGDDFIIQDNLKTVRTIAGRLGKSVKKTKHLKTQEEFEEVLEVSKAHYFKANKH